MEVVYVDQSGKVEQTNRDTVVAATNSRSAVVIIRSREKQRLYRYIAAHRRKNLYLRVFAYAVFRAIENMIAPDIRIVIDPEYYGKEHTIREMLLDLAAGKPDPLNPKRIVFERVGRRSKAHALSVLEAKPGRVIIIREKELEGAVG